METRAAKRKRVIDTCAVDVDGISPKRQRHTIVVTPGCLSRELRGLGFAVSAPQLGGEQQSPPVEQPIEDFQHQHQHQHHQEPPSSPSPLPVPERCSHLRLGIRYDAIRKTLLDSSQWYCQDCGSTRSLWACLTCGMIGCGRRYMEKHSQQHYLDTGHPLVLEISSSLLCHCYLCDAYIPEDNKRGDLAKLRAQLRHILATEESDDSSDSQPSASPSPVPPLNEGAPAVIPDENDEDLLLPSKYAQSAQEHELSDTFATALLHWRNNLMYRALYKWVSLTDFNRPISPDHAKRIVTQQSTRPTPTSSYSTPFLSNTGPIPSATASAALLGEAHDAKHSRLLRSRSTAAFPAPTLSSRNHRDEPHHDDATSEDKKYATPVAGGSNGYFTAPPPPPPPPPPSLSTTPTVTFSFTPSRIQEELLQRRSSISNLGRTTSRLLTHGQTGLRNLGNTCFMNAVLQAIGHIKQLREFMINDLFPREGSSVLLKNQELIRTDTIDCMRAVSKKTQLNVDQLSICNEIHRLLRVLWSGKWAIITPSALLDSLWKFVPQFRNYKQQDAQEFLYCILDRMNQELTDVFRKNSGSSTIIDQVFGGEVENRIVCCQCGAQSITKEAFLDLQLDLPVVHLAKSTRSQTKIPTCSLADCFDKFTVPADIESYRCERCASEQKAKRYTLISKPPNVLIVVLKRFCWTASTRAKIDTIVNFPLTGLNLSSYIKGKPNVRYNAKSIVAHHGNGFKVGHYTSVAYNDPSNSWCHFNDASVKKIPDSEVMSRCHTPYLIFFERASQSISVSLASATSSKTL